MAESRAMTIQIENLTEAQAIAIEDMMRTWQVLGSWGSSRWTAFYADGDGNFRPKITVNGKPAEFTKLLPRNHFWPQGDGGDYRIDFDSIAWKLRAEREAGDV